MLKSWRWKEAERLLAEHAKLGEFIRFAERRKPFPDDPETVGGHIRAAVGVNISNDLHFDIIDTEHPEAFAAIMAVAVERKAEIVKALRAIGVEVEMRPAKEQVF